MPERTLIKSARLVSAGVPLEHDIADVLIEDGKVAAIGMDLVVESAEVIDAQHKILAPGFVDGHRHVWQTQLRNVCTDFSLWEYVLHIRLVWSTLYTDEDVYLGNYLGALEALDAGITTIVDHCHAINSPEHADAAVRGLLDSGIRGIFCFGTFPNEPRVPVDVPTDPEWRYKAAKTIRNGLLSSDSGLIQFGFAPLELEGFPFEVVSREIEFARSLNSAALSCHIATGAYDRGNQMAKSLRDKGILGPDFLLVHGSSFTDEEIDIIRDAGAGIISTPETDLQMAMGHPVASRAHEAGARTGLGIDIVSNFAGDMFAQMRLGLQAERGVRNAEFDRAKKPPRKISPKAESFLEMATLGVARAIHKENVIGSLEVGKDADLILVSTDALHMMPTPDPIGGLVMNARPSDIECVMVAGRFVKRDGKLIDDDLGRLRNRFRDSASILRSRFKQEYLDAAFQAPLIQELAPE